MKRLILYFIQLTVIFCSAAGAQPFVAVMDMQMGIFPGTKQYLETTLKEAHEEGAVILVVNLNTPGGMLNTTQEMIKILFESPIPTVFYVSPTSSMAASAGVFVTMAAHIAAMAPGTSIGAAHPVQGDGKDIDGDMRAKAENMTVAMVQSLAKQRGRNVAWAEKSVRESASLTDSEAQKQGVVDLVAKDLSDLLRQINGKQVSLPTGPFLLKDYSELPRKTYQISTRDKIFNALSDPQVLALLWLGATTGLSIELYNPGAILPGVVGVICLVLALLVSQVIPVNVGAIALIVIGTLMIGAELIVPSGILAIGGLIALVLGSLYIVDQSKAPDLVVNTPLILGMALTVGLLMLSLIYALIRAIRGKVVTGKEGLVGKIGTTVEKVSTEGRISLQGEFWKAQSKEGIIEPGVQVKVLGLKPGLILEVEKFDS